jgi:aromatic-L-amino-acid/L-tryptophan decarboxylase
MAAVTIPPPPVPDLDWDAERGARFAQRAVELWAEWLGALREAPVTSGVTPAAARAALARDVPDEPMGEDELFAYLREMTFEWSMFPGHPRFMAYVSGAGTVPGAATEVLAAGLNMNLGGAQLSPSGTEIELNLGRWFARQFGITGERAGGYLTSGGAMATYVALKAARDRAAGVSIRQTGVAGAGPMAIYASPEVHDTTPRAADMMGLGTDAIRRIEVDDGYRMSVPALREAIARDLAAGVKPVAVVGSAGTVSTGAIDPLDEIADVCTEHGIWFHVDGAYGGPAVFADDLRPLLSGIERADSVAFDPHKWLYVPLACGCLVVRDLQWLEDAFSLEASYTYADAERLGHPVGLRNFGGEFSRGFAALKVWVSLLAHGRRAYAARISHDAALARYVGERVEERDDFERSAPVGLSICCFRYVPPDLPPAGMPGREEYLDELNRRVMTEVQLDGRVFFSNAVLGDRFVLRVCIVNFRTEAEDMDAVLDVAAELGAKIDADLRPEALRIAQSGDVR